MDVDIAVVVYPDGRKEYYFLMGIGYIFPGPQDYDIDKNGWVYGPNVWGLVPLVHDWAKDIEKAKKTPIPKTEVVTQ